MIRLLRTTARPVELMLGAFFVFAALLKVQHPGLFAVQIHEYHVLEDKALLGPAALFFITLEMGLGAAMLMGLRLRLLVLAVVQCVLLFFTGLILYAWTFHGLKDCGCMGELRMGPGVSTFKNLAMMAGVVWAWLGFRRQERLPETIPSMLDKFAAAFVVSAVALGASYLELYRERPVPRIPPSAQADNETAPLADPGDGTGPFSAFVIEDDAGRRYDLARGTYLVALLSATCEHCMASVPTLNEYTLRPDVLPPLLGLCYEPEPGSLEEFRITTGVMFPLYSLGNDFLTFVNYIDREPPRLSLVRDGIAVHSWDNEMPSVDNLIAWLEKEKATTGTPTATPPAFE